jgi:uncharacterized protein YqeY
MSVKPAPLAATRRSLATYTELTRLRPGRDRLLAGSLIAGTAKPIDSATLGRRRQGALRNRLEEALKTATLSRDQRAMSTLRLILAALRDRDIAERSKGNLSGLSDEQIIALLHSMVKQRRESISLYESGGRDDLARQEAEEITVIEQFMPPQMSEAEVDEAVGAVIAEAEARTLKDMGRVMAVLRERYAGRMDMARAGSRVKGQLT